MNTKEAKKVLKLLDENLLNNVYENFFIDGGMEELYVSFADFCEIPYQKINEKNIKTLFFRFSESLRNNSMQELELEQKDTFIYSRPKKKNREADMPYLVRNKMNIPPAPKAEAIRGDLSASNFKGDTSSHFQEIMARIKEKVSNLTNGLDFARLCCEGLAKGITTKMDYRTGSGYIARFWEENKSDLRLLDQSAFVCQFLGYDSIPIDFKKGEFSKQFILRHFKRIISNRDLPINSWRYWFIELTGDRRDKIFKFYNRKLSRIEINEIFRDFYDQAKDKHETKQDLYNHFDRWFAKINFKYLHQNNDI